jgi:hypothetical protein
MFFLCCLSVTAFFSPLVNFLRMARVFLNRRSVGMSGFWCEVGEIVAGKDREGGHREGKRDVREVKSRGRRGGNGFK